MGGSLRGRRPVSFHGAKVDVVPCEALLFVSQRYQTRPPGTVLKIPKIMAGLHTQGFTDGKGLALTIPLLFFALSVG